MRLQLEALLAEKSRLANENANLTRENQCLNQLVEYHQLTSQEISATYEQVIQGMCLDFSSTPASIPEEANRGDGDGDRAPETPRTKIFGLSTVLDECYDEQENWKYLSPVRSSFKILSAGLAKFWIELYWNVNFPMELLVIPIHSWTTVPVNKLSGFVVLLDIHILLGFPFIFIGQTKIPIHMLG